MVARLDPCNPDALRLLLNDRLPPAAIGELERLLKRLGDFHLRISLARLSLDRHGNEAVSKGQMILEGLQDPCAIAGTMTDGSIVAAFLGPRGADNTVGDSETTARIRQRFRRALRSISDAAGWKRLDGQRAIRRSTGRSSPVTMS